MGKRGGPSGPLLLSLIGEILLEIIHFLLQNVVPHPTTDHHAGNTSQGSPKSFDEILHSRFLL